MSEMKILIDRYDVIESSDPVYPYTKMEQVPCVQERGSDSVAFKTIGVEHLTPLKINIPKTFEEKEAEVAVIKKTHPTMAGLQKMAALSNVKEIFIYMPKKLRELTGIVDCIEDQNDMIYRLRGQVYTLRRSHSENLEELDTLKSKGVWARLWWALGD